MMYIVISISFASDLHPRQLNHGFLISEMPFILNESPSDEIA